jgi:spermidine/putrescine-binding protein
MIELTRRGLIGGAAVAALLPAAARAQASELVVGTWAATTATCYGRASTAPS